MKTLRLIACATTMLAGAAALAQPVPMPAPDAVPTWDSTAHGRPMISDGERAADSIAIQNLMSTHEFMHAAGRNLEELNTYWVDQNGPYAATATFASPAWVMYGLDTVKRAYGQQSHSDAEANLAKLAAIDPSVKNTPANFGAGAEWVMHTSTTAVIEIAGDGKTAQGAWYSPGIGIMPAYQDGKIHLQPTMFYEKYGGDFVKENGRWRIWHLQMAYDFVPGLPQEMVAKLNDQLGKMALGQPLKTSGVEAGERMGGAMPPGFRKPKYVYATFSPQRASAIWPNLPRPYYTFAETYNNCNCDEVIPQ